MGLIGKALNIGSRSRKGFKYSDVAPAVDEMISDALEHLDIVDKVRALTREQEQMEHSVFFPNAHSDMFYKDGFKHPT